MVCVFVQMTSWRRWTLFRWHRVSGVVMFRWQIHYQQDVSCSCSLLLNPCPPRSPLCTTTATHVVDRRLQLVLPRPYLVTISTLPFCHSPMSRHGSMAQWLRQLTQTRHVDQVGLDHSQNFKPCSMPDHTLDLGDAGSILETWVSNGIRPKSPQCFRKHCR